MGPKFYRNRQNCQNLVIKDTMYPFSDFTRYLLISLFLQVTFWWDWCKVSSLKQKSVNRLLTLFCVLYANCYLSDSLVHGKNCFHFIIHALLIIRNSINKRVGPIVWWQQNFSRPHQNTGSPNRPKFGQQTVLELFAIANSDRNVNVYT